MKRLSLIVVIICFVQLTSAQTLIAPETASNLKELGLKGPVKVLTEYAYEMNKDTSGKRTKAIFQYDRNGNLLVEILYSPNGMITSKAVYQYKKKDIIIINQFNFKGKQVNKLILKYDNQKRLIEAVQYALPSTSVVYRTVFKYNNNGNEIERDHYDFKGHKDWPETTFYNEKNQKTEVDNVSDFNSKILYAYDTSGQLTKEQVVNKTDLSVCDETTYVKYDKYGNWLIRTAVETPRGMAATTAYLMREFNANIKITEPDFEIQLITEREIKYFN
ncbi:MAG: hypothetical protein ACHQIM_13205 [Sphingobacteriales bacterium]